VGDWRHRILEGVTWIWQRGESWVIEGPNGSGKSALAALWVGRLDAVAGEMVLAPGSARSEEAWIGFERQRLLLEAERQADDSDYRESADPGTVVRDFVGNAALLTEYGLADKGSRGLKHLSTGELRRACLARAEAQRVPFLLLDEPFEGLDLAGVTLLTQRIAAALQRGTDLVFFTQRADLAPGGLTRRWTLASPVAVPTLATEDALGPAVFGAPPLPGQPVLEFRGVNAGYGALSVLKDFDWTVRQGERWLVTGPNGSGKSTLMALIAGDHPQVFSNNVRIAGRRRGPELTLDQLRGEVALVSYAAHLKFRNLQRTTGLEVLASGFAGTIGLWDEPSWSQVQACRQVAADWGLEDAADRLWEELSWGTQRLFLLARALVAGQKLLLLDEPCQGLDGPAQRRFLQAVAQWAQNPRHTLIYVTHRLDEIDASTFQSLRLSTTQTQE
jgi:molybdate transport system ATP-binding protein